MFCFVCCLLCFTPSPFTDLFCCGELDTGCVSAAGMKDWVDRLTSALRGDGCLFCVIGGVCDVLCICVRVCGCGCGCTTGCGGVLWDGVFVVLSELVDVHCPQGSKLCGEDSVLCFCVPCVLTCCSDARTIGWNVEVL